jgi:hypothetical protein
LNTHASAANTASLQVINRQAQAKDHQSRAFKNNREIDIGAN